MIEDLQKLGKDIANRIEKCSSHDDLENLNINVFGRKGELTLLLKNIASLDVEQKKVVGREANKIKNELLGAFQKKENGFSSEKKDIDIDVTEPGKKYSNGHIHPINKVMREVEDIFQSMGFSVVEGPELDTEYNNFDALNIPETHPARDMQDTFFLEDSGLLMRTHTSNTQNRIYRMMKPPFQVIIPGRCFRNEATDASHDITFHQVEGLAVGKDISLSHLKGVMKEFLSKLFGKEVKVRFRPGYFPFVEPGLELDFSCLLCEGKGCSVCKKTGWLEFMGCGMVHPNVLEMGGIDPNEWNGFAFGFGLTRLALMRYGIEDIRHFHSGNFKFLEQF